MNFSVDLDTSEDDVKYLDTSDDAVKYLFMRFAAFYLNKTHQFLAAFRYGDNFNEMSTKLLKEWSVNGRISADVLS